MRIVRCSTLADALRNIVFRFDGLPAFARALREGDQELALPSGEAVADGEWVLAMFEVGGERGNRDRRRATASAARGIVRHPGQPGALAFAWPDQGLQPAHVLVIGHVQRIEVQPRAPDHFDILLRQRRRIIGRAAKKRRTRIAVRRTDEMIAVVISIFVRQQA